MNARLRAWLRNEVVKEDGEDRDCVHPNRLRFRGVLTRVDERSDKAPSGARGHRVVLTREAAEAALPTLIGMALNLKDGLAGHNVRQKVGVVIAAEIVGHELRVDGFLYEKDFPELAEGIRGSKMGMSYELADAHVADMRAMDWTLTRVTFTGAAILLRKHAAYKGTRFELVDDAEAKAFDAEKWSREMVASIDGVAEE